MCAPISTQFYAERAVFEVCGLKLLGMEPGAHASSTF